ncbi:hypothetical protein ABZ907_33910 [Nonomuraea wenchangensis]
MPPSTVPMAGATPGLVQLVRVEAGGTPDADRCIGHLVICLIRSISDILMATARPGALTVFVRR